MLNIHEMLAVTDHNTSKTQIPMMSVPQAQSNVVLTALQGHKLWWFL